MIKQVGSKTGTIWSYVESHRDNGLVVDLGGGNHPHPDAMTVIDLTKKPDEFIGYWFRHDMCDEQWARELFKIKEFDYVFCSGALEDVAYPIGALGVATRIAPRGLFVTPHWTYEAGIRLDREDCEKVSGWPHHRWLVGINKRTSTYEFMGKYSWFVAGEYPTSREYLSVEWDGGDFEFADISYVYPGPSLREELLCWLEDRWEL